MKYDISRQIKDYSNSLDGKLEDIVNKAIIFAQEEVVSKAPVDTYNYVSQMAIEKAKREKNIVSGRVFNNVVVTTKGGKTYALGELLENGTRPHAIPNAFGKGYYYGYTDENGRFHKGTLDDDWHPGFKPIPHWQPAFDKTSIYLDKLLKEKL